MFSCVRCMKYLCFTRRVFCCISEPPSSNKWTRERERGRKINLFLFNLSRVGVVFNTVFSPLKEHPLLPAQPEQHAAPRKALAPLAAPARSWFSWPGTTQAMLRWEEIPCCMSPVVISDLAESSSHRAGAGSPVRDDQIEMSA